MCVCLRKTWTQLGPYQFSIVYLVNDSCASNALDNYYEDDSCKTLSPIPDPIALKPVDHDIWHVSHASCTLLVSTES